MKKIFGSFFRSDLDLGGFWLHRLSVIVFAVLCVFVVFFQINEVSNGGGFIPTWKKVGVVSDRITDDVRLLGELVEKDETVETFFSEPLSFKHYVIENKDVLNNFFCSNNIANQLEEVKTVAGAESFALSYSLGYHHFHEDEVSQDTLRDELLERQVRCLRKETKLSGLSYFLYPPDSSYIGNVSTVVETFPIYEKSTTLTFFDYIISVLIPLTIFSLLALILYYQVIIYIIFGKRKSKN